MPDAKETLKEWCSSGKLSEASLTSDGATLTLGDVSLPGKENITVSSADGKEAQYTLGSIFLQILDPDQSLPKYRMACKKHAVTDPVKALDKPIIVGFFLSSSSSSSAAPPAAAAAAPVEAAAAEAEKPAAAADSSKPPEHRKDKDADRKRSSSSSSKHHDKHRRDKKRPPSHHKDKHRDKHAKKHRSMVTNEQLFSNLNVVVDKRGKQVQPGAPSAPGGDESKSKEATSPDLVEEPRNEEFEAIRKALSPEGFQVTPEMLEKHKEITETLMAHEIPVGDSASVLRASSVGANLSRVLNLFVETVNPSKGKKSSGQSPIKKSARPYLAGKKPIILLPKGMTAPITMVNGYEFFANSRFYPRDVVMKTKSLQANMKTTKFSRKMPGVGQIEYELLDNPRKLQTKEEWERVVAVVVLGHKWQFKDWPGKYSDPVQLFAKVFGFYVGIEGDTLPADLVGWAVLRSKLHRDKRGLDSVTHASFWNALDEWIKIHKPELVPHGME